MDINIPKNLIKGTFSIPYQKGQEYQKGKFQKIKIKDKEVFQLSLFTEKQVFHRNIELSRIDNELIKILTETFRCLELYTLKEIYYYKITDKGKLLTNRKKVKNDFVVLEHNRSKKYLLPEGIAIPPLVDLGVMTPDGKIVKGKNDKFKQINRFLEIIEDSIAKENQLKIIDFGCGKSYLTFILYYYLVYIKKMEIEIIGLDLKEDVIDQCDKITQKYGYHNLKFMKGNIADYKEQDGIDMIVTLHACDTATDYALYHAIQMKCRYVFSVPSCQHEVNAQIKSNQYHFISKYGILKERMAAILTDAIRANILQYCGYKTQVLEFVDLDASPKNILIRAILENLPPNPKIKEELDNMIKQLGIQQTLYQSIFQNKSQADINA